MASELFNRITINASVFEEAVTVILPFVAVMGGVMIPLQLKFGIERSRIVLMVLCGIVVMVAVISSKADGAAEWFLTAKDAVRTMNKAVLMIALFAVFVVVTMVSIFISLKIIEKRSFDTGIHTL